MATKLKPVDVVTVGVGLTGTILAKELADTGLKVVGLERGRWRDTDPDFAMPGAHDELKYVRRHELMQDLSKETLTFRNAMSETALPMRSLGSFLPGEGVGGAAVHWGGLTWRFLPWDFETKSRTLARYGKNQVAEDCTLQDWGVTYDELEPHFDRFEYLYGISGKAGNLQGKIIPGGNPFEGPRSREYPNPPLKTAYSSALFAKAAQAMGYKPFPVPTGANSRPYKNEYGATIAACVYCGYCQFFGCEMGAKASPQTAVLPALMQNKNFELRTLCNVVKVNLDSDKKRAVSVTYVDSRGREFEQPADLVLLTSYVLNNTRLMLLSGIGKPYDPVANTGVVGRNYAYQTPSSVTLFFEDKNFNSFMGAGGLGLAIDEFNGDNFDHSGLGFIGGGFMQAGSNGARPIEVRPVPAGTPRWGSEWKKAAAKYFNRSFSITIQGACQSYRTNYLDLDPTYRDAYGLPLLRMTFDRHENETKMSAWLTNKAAEIAKAVGPAKMNVSPRTGKYTIVPYQSTHNTGGAVMGADPATSAVNKYLQSWDVPNVFAVGASAFPQNGGYNPTGTVGALTFQALEAIKTRYLKRPGALA
ncbi:MAG: GMC family oxidoreductase [Betaproteobacteria bacterium]|nr:MAG: GMC family oxidoreductase [Betaproteobacteria bacterium]